MKRALAAAAVVCSASRANAAPCGRPDLVETLPPDGARGIPVNARPAARYVPSAEYLNEPVAIEHVGVGSESAMATFDANEGLLAISPAVPFVPNDVYKISWPALRGLTTAMLGKGAETQFTAGSLEDAQPPQFSGVRSIGWDIERSNDDCTGDPQDRYRFDIALGDLSDDGGRDLLTLVLFQTAPNPTGSPVPVLVQRVPEVNQEVHVRRAVDDAVGRVCIAALVRDSLGRVSASTPEACVTTVRPPFFYGCALAPSGERSWLPLLGFLSVGALMRRRRARCEAA